MPGGIGERLAHHRGDAARDRGRRLGVQGAVDRHPADPAAGAQQAEGDGKLLALVGQGVDAAAHGVESLVQPRVERRQVGHDAGLVAVADPEGLDRQEEAGQEVPDAVVDLPGDPRALGEGRGAHLMVLRLEEPGIGLLQGEDLLAQVVPHRMEALARRLVLPGAQRQQSRKGPDRHGEDESRFLRCPPHDGEQQRGAAQQGDTPIPPEAERGNAHEVVDDQRRARNRRRRRTAQEEISAGNDDQRAPPVRHRAQPARDDGQEQPYHRGGFRRVSGTSSPRRPGEQRQQAAGAEDHTLVGQYPHTTIISDRSAAHVPGGPVSAPPHSAHDRSHGPVPGP